MKTVVILELDVDQWYALGSVARIQKAIDTFLAPTATTTTTTSTTTTDPGVAPTV